MSASPAGEPASHEPVRPKVVYVMGSGRSGSTILGVTLGNCDGLFFVGELDRWLPSGGTPSLGGTERTRFWGDVRERVAAPPEMMSDRARNTLERARGPLRPAGWIGRRRLRARYRQVTGDLFRAVADVSNAEHVVDTSHFPLRARELRGIEGVDVYLLFMVRDPGRMLASFTRTLGARDFSSRLRLVLSTNIDLWVTHLLAIAVFLSHRRDRRLFLHYEDFTADPPRVLRQILELIGSSAETPDLRTLHTGMAMGGNVLLRSETVSLEGENRTPAPGSRLTELLQLPLTAIMGRLRPAVAATAPDSRAAAA